MVRARSRFQPTLEVAESRTLLSGAVAAALPSAPHILHLRGKMHMVFTAGVTTKADHETITSLSLTQTWTGRLSTLGSTRGSQSVVANAPANASDDGGYYHVAFTGPLVLKTARGQVSLVLTPPANKHNRSLYNFTIAGGTEAFQGATGRGTIFATPQVHMTRYTRDQTEVHSTSMIVRLVG